MQISSYSIDENNSAVDEIFKTVLHVLLFSTNSYCWISIILKRMAVVNSINVFKYKYRLMHEGWTWVECMCEAACVTIVTAVGQHREPTVYS